MANNNYLGVVDANGKRLFKKKLPNDPEMIWIPPTIWFYLDENGPCTYFIRVPYVEEISCRRNLPSL